MTHLILVGGFLGAGKTTLLLAAGRLLHKCGLRVGLVTNDQGGQLVDTALAQQANLPVVEVAGGCFCCRLPDLMESLAVLQRTVAPDVILAEPVGSCTDIIATVMRPLAARPNLGLEIAPFTVLVDALRLAQTDKGMAGYIYRKQLEEAELIGVTKLDLVDPPLGRKLLHGLHQRFGPSRVRALDAIRGSGVDDWLQEVRAHTSAMALQLDINYAAYAAAEAALGWLNATGVVESDVPFSPSNWLAYFLRMLDDGLRGSGASTAHLKAQVTSGHGSGTAVHKASLTLGGGPLSWDGCMAGDDGKTTRLEFILNARVETSPQVLERVVRSTMAELSPEQSFHYSFTDFTCISPAAPQPSERIPA